MGFAKSFLPWIEWYVNQSLTQTVKHNQILNNDDIFRTIHGEIKYAPMMRLVPAYIPIHKRIWFKSLVYCLFACVLFLGLLLFYSRRKLAQYASALEKKVNTRTAAQRQNEERFRTVIEASQDAMIEINSLGLITLFNPAAEEMFGRKAEEMIGSIPGCLMPEEFREVHNKKLESFFSTGSPNNAIGSTIELTAVRSDGKEFPIDLTLSAGQHGDEQFVLAIIRDITKRKRDQQSLEEREKIFREAIEVAGAIPYFHDYKMNTYDFSTSGIEDLLGYSIDELTPDFWEALTEEVIHKGDHKNLSLEETVEKARGEEGLNWRADYRMRTKNGQHKWIANAAVQIRDEKGVLVGSFGILQDITERKQVEEDLCKYRDKLDAVLTSVPLPLFAKDREGRYIIVNPALVDFFGIPEDDLIGRTAEDCFDSKDSYDHHLNDLELMEEDNFRVDENRVKNGHGEYREVIFTKACFHDADGLVNGLVGTLFDITDRKNLEEQLVQSQKMEAVGQLAGGIAHDFNNLLTGILGYSELMLMRLNENDPNFRPVSEIKRASESAASLIRQLLAFSRKQILEPEIINLNDLIVKMDKMLRRIIGEDIELVTLVDINIGNIKADPGQIEQIILNLSINARDAIHGCGKLTIETEDVKLEESYTVSHSEVEPGEYVLLTISDSGHGMDKKTQDMIFEPFFTTKAKGKGTGLGLSTVYGIVKQSGGYIYVYSEVDRGSSFTIYFPRVSDNITSIKFNKSEETALSGTETILLVEDEDVVREMASSVLNSYGYNVIEASYHVEAEEAFEKHQGIIDIMVTDVIMPQMSGKELAKKLLLSKPELKVLFMSGYTDGAIVHHGVLEKGINFIQKPFMPDALAKKIRDVLDGNL